MIINPFRSALILVAALAAFAGQVVAQTETATISGLITDSSGASIVGAEIQLRSVERGTFSDSRTNASGIYVLSGVSPGRYHLSVRKDGFKQVDLVDLVVNIQDHLQENVRLQVGSVAESVTVSGAVTSVNTQDASVSTVVDRQFADNLPMNGRSFQTLIQLTPGVVLTPSSNKDAGQFSINGQRSSSNYWMVDGVSANIGIGSDLTGNGLAGGLGSFSASGGTNSLVSVDALQEFRIQTSTYAPEFGRVPGGQISILTRSGTNQFHGTVFDYIRNDVFDANDWFADFAGLQKPAERQNDFGGTFGGPIIKDRAFFFGSYEGLRLRLPRTVLSTVPDLAARQNATTALKPYLNAFPLPNGPEDSTNPGEAQFNAAFSDAASLNAYSLRIDYKLNPKWLLFARYNYSPSVLAARGNGFSANTIISSGVRTQTGTVGVTTAISSRLTNDLRFNDSRTRAPANVRSDNFGGAVPLTSLPIPASVNPRNAQFDLQVFSLKNDLGIAYGGGDAVNVQRQTNLVDSVSLLAGSHTVKFGVDFRRLSPLSRPLLYGQGVGFNDVPSLEVGQAAFSFVDTMDDVNLIFRNLGVFAQDTWHLAPRLTLTYGLRWDVDFSPTANGPNLSAVTGFNLQDTTNLRLAPAGTAPFATRYGNVAPRLGVAYQVVQSSEWQTVLRGGFGVFYDLVTSQAGNSFSPTTYPFGAQAFNFGGNFPLPPEQAAPPVVSPPDTANGNPLFAYDPHIRLPYTLQWNVSLEQALGTQQTLSASYLGASGRRLLQTALFVPPNSNYSEADLIANTATSNYNALQIQFERRLSRGLQALASYNWSHSIDDGSAGSSGSFSNVFSSKANRGSSDFDIRNAFSTGITYAIPVPKLSAIPDAVMRGWSIQSVIQARTAVPVNIGDAKFGQLSLKNLQLQIRPDTVPGQPLYVFGSQCIAALGPPCAGGKGFNPAAFADPPTDPNTGSPLRQGDLPRNALRGFGLTQWDFAVHRDFQIHESLRLQFRAETFNVLNHPNFGPPNGSFGTGGFGQSSQMYGQSLNAGFGGNLGGGAFDPLYQVGGPRSAQFALKLMF